MSFLVLMLAGLGTLARLEATSSGVAARQAQARALALMAQQVALNRLQISAGPDGRVTATAGTGAHHARWTGVWDATNHSREPLTWLVSGDEAAPATPNEPLAPGAFVPLVSVNSSGITDEVVAPLRPFAFPVPGLDGTARETLLGRYAWWVGDQGVKAPVGDAGQPEPDYPPYDSPETRARLRQVSSGPGATNIAGHPIFDPLSPANAELLRDRELIAEAQLPFLRDANGQQVDVARSRENYWAWSAGNSAVLASTLTGGLRQDLSLRPELLGPGFEVWMNYAGYLEDPAAPGGDSDFTIAPAYGAEPLRRRHRIVAPVGKNGIVFANAPVLASFFLQFNVRRVGGNAAPASTNALEVRARMVVQLWNPWTTAIVPEPLWLEVTGLPDIVIRDSNGGSSTASLAGLFGQPLKVELTPVDAAFPGDPDDHSWLPGRVYAWRSRGGAPATWLTEFYNRTLSVPNASIWVVPAGAAYAGPASNSVQLWVTGAATELTLTLRKPEGTSLWQVRSPRFAAFSTAPQRVNANDEYRFGFPIRLVDPVDFAAAPGDGQWLTGTGQDPRDLLAREPLYRLGPGGDLPSAYVGVGGNSVLTDENRLLDRVMGKTGMSYNEDTPVFELLRSPPLSLGQLQHLQVAGARPFSIGNSWGANVSLGGVPALEVFDRYFFSGLAPGIEPVSSGGRFVLPQSRLRRTSRRVQPADLRAVPDGYSARFLLQAGAFNLNSTEVAAWIAVLRSSRITPERAPTYLAAQAATGTAGDDAIAQVPAAFAAFYRFPQSAQETFQADPGYAATPAVPPAEPATASLANTHLYRPGIRTLDQARTVQLAEAIVRGVRWRHARAGPFRSVAGFLGPQPEFENRSLLEQALLEAGINDGVAEFSSQWLTQADIMTSLAPILFARSDTFLIRSYGEATNPATGTVEARAWCEARVQRVPEYFDARSDAPETPPASLASAANQRCGRRFQVISFRWLTRFDI